MRGSGRQDEWNQGSGIFDYTLSMGRRTLVLFLAIFTLTAEEKVNLSVIQRIKAEAFENSQAMDHLFYLADVYGPRLTNSPGHRAAADWVVKRLQSYGLQNVRLEKWGPFGQSWKLNHFSAHLLEPQYQPLIGFPLAWTPGTDGVVTGEPMLAVMRTEADFEKFKGKLKGKIVMTMEPKEILPITEPLSRRWTAEELLARETVADPSRMGPGGFFQATGGRGQAAGAAIPPNPRGQRFLQIRLRLQGSATR